MPDSQQKPWSNDLNAPKIPYDLHLREKNNVIGTFISSIFYGTRKTSLPTRPYIRPYLVCLACSRDGRYVVLQMYGRSVQPRPSQGGVCQVGAYILHRGYVLVCDNTQRGGL